MRVLPLALFAAACATTAVPPQTIRPPPPPPRIEPIGLIRVLGHGAGEAIALLGLPSLDRVEGRARELQFTRGPCVLDLFLYPPKLGSGEPLIGYAAARLKSGKALDPASCLQSQLLTKK